MKIYASDLLTPEEEMSFYDMKQGLRKKPKEIAEIKMGKKLFLNGAWPWRLRSCCNIQHRTLYLRAMTHS